MSSPTLSFDGTDDYVDFGSYVPRSGSNARCCAAWIKIPSGDGTQNTIMEWGTRSTGERWQWRVIPSGEQIVDTYNSNTTLRGSSNLKDDNWHHVVVTYDGTTSNTAVNFYVDGNIDNGTISSNSINTATTTGLGIGRSGLTTGAYFNGDMDSVGIGGSELSKSQVNDVMDGNFHPLNNLKCAMNEGSGTTLTDASGAPHNGTIYGATWSTRSGGNTYDWESGDWGSPQSHDDVNTNYGEVIIGQNLTHLMDSTEEARYIMDGNTSESQLHDDSGNGNHSVSTNNITFSGEPDNKFIGSYWFNGTDSYVELPTAVQDTSGIIGTEMWFYPESRGNQRLFDSMGFYQINYDKFGNKNVNIGVYGDNFSPSFLPPLDTWHHLNMYWNIGTEIGVSVNGKSWETYATSETVDNRSNPRYFGKDSNNSSYFDGRMTEIRFVAGQQIPENESLYQTNGTLLTGTQP